MDGSKVGQVWMVSDPPDGTSVGPSLTWPQEQWCASLVDEAVAHAVVQDHSPRFLDIETVPLVSLENTHRFKPMFEPGNYSFIQDSLCWRGADVMVDRSGSLKLGSFKLLDVGGREPGCLGRGCMLSDAALCSNVDFSQILLLPTPGRTAHDAKEVGSQSICWHTFLTWVPKVIRRSYVTTRNVGEGVQLGGTPLMVIWGRHCTSALSRLKKSTSHFAALRVRRACWLQLTTLSTSACILRATCSFLRPWRLERDHQRKH